MKLLSRHLIVTGLAILLAAAVISYQAYKDKTSDQSIERYTQPLISSRLHAVVTDLSVTSADERIQSQNAMVYSLKVRYIDLDSGKDSSFVMNNFSDRNVDIGDTVLKEKGSVVLSVHKKQGSITALQVR